MSDTTKNRGGSHTARAKGLIGIVVHVSPADHAALSEAARQAGIPLKEFCRRAALKEAGATPSAS